MFDVCDQPSATFRSSCIVNVIQSLDGCKHFVLSTKSKGKNYEGLQQIINVDNK